jgi:hypothetical protein
MSKKNIILTLSLVVNSFFLIILAIYFFTPMFLYQVMQINLPRFCEFASSKEMMEENKEKDELYEASIMGYCDFDFVKESYLNQKEKGNLSD